MEIETYLSSEVLLEGKKALLVYMQGVVAGLEDSSCS